jgi:hypothetical protein
MPNQYDTPFNWVLWLQWVFTTTLGWLLSLALLPHEIGVGLIIGTAQWLIIRPIFPQAWWWIITSAAGWSLGWGMVSLFSPPQIETLVGAIYGATTGLVQWMILRRWIPKAGWWIITSALGWAVGLAGFVSSPLVGAVVGAVTGIAFELLIRFNNK